MGFSGIYKQFTQTGLFANEKWACRIDGEVVRTTPREHYRLVTDAAGYSLKTLRGPEELLHAAYDVFTGEPWTQNADSIVPARISFSGSLQQCEMHWRKTHAYIAISASATSSYSKSPAAESAEDISSTGNRQFGSIPTETLCISGAR